MRGLFITGTDTDAGKTTVTAALLRALMLAGVPAAAVKPVQTGCVMRGEKRSGGRREPFWRKVALLPPYPPPPSQDFRLVGRPHPMRELFRRVGIPCRMARVSAL